MRKLLIIAHSFPPSSAPGAARPWRFYKYLPQFGYETHVLTALPRDKPLPRVTYIPPAVGVLKERLLRKFLYPLDEDVLWTRPALREAERIVSEQGIDIVLSTVPPMHGHTVAHQLKKRMGIPWIADYRDPIVGNPFRSSGGLPGRLDRRMDQKFFQAADLLVAVTDRIEAQWIEQNPAVQGKTAVLWNGFDPEEHIAAEQIPRRNYRIVAHFGSFYGGRDPVISMRSLSRLVSRGQVNPSTIRLSFTGALEPVIRSKHSALFADLTKMGCLECLPPVPRAEALADMMKADYLMLADSNDSGIGHTVPAKLFEYIRVGRPILALTVSGSPVDQILRTSGVRYVVLSPGMSDSVIDQKMLEFVQMPTDPIPISESFSREFDGKRQAKTLASLLDGVLEGRQVESVHSVA